LVYSDFCNAGYNAYYQRAVHTDHVDSGCTNWGNGSPCGSYYVDDSGCHAEGPFSNWNNHANTGHGDYDAHTNGYG
jgi:hypothetical protein